MSKKVVVVTGVSSGIGASIFSDLQSHGYAVVGVARTPPVAELPDDVEWVVGDVGDSTTGEEAARVAAKLGTLHGWVNNAGVLEDVPLHLISDERIDATLRTNLRGTLLGTRAALREFIRTATPGVIVNMGSIHGRAGFPGTPAYDATKGGIEAVTRYAAAEYGHLGIRVNTVAPGAIKTEMLAQALLDAPDGEQLERDFSALHPLNRLGESIEVANVVRFLLSDDASFVSGATIPVDGGAAARVFNFPPHHQVPSAISRADLDA
ncbi:SDR family NAD(P)-dependent oxidoreductase [Amnibacterium flavum]|uniref:Adhesin n=1 Tax=Amnibacterium flavum TaxID=2173173 RepID=A0A2V1HLF8_9MICO|nr:SDR family oxidoreductase [Amnibacterium flavum]PVZ93241.1 adhesin [Amnibacterium flavum]